MHECICCVRTISGDFILFKVQTKDYIYDCKAGFFPCSKLVLDQIIVLTLFSENILCQQIFLELKYFSNNLIMSLVLSYIDE